MQVEGGGWTVSSVGMKATEITAEKYSALHFNPIPQLLEYSATREPC